MLTWPWKMGEGCRSWGPSISGRSPSDELSHESKIVQRIFWWPFYKLIKRTEVWANRVQWYDRSCAELGISITYFVCNTYTQTKGKNDLMWLVPTLETPHSDRKSTLTGEPNDRMHGEISMLKKDDDVNKRWWETATNHIRWKSSKWFSKWASIKIAHAIFLCGFLPKWGRPERLTHPDEAASRSPPKPELEISTYT